MQNPTHAAIVRKLTAAGLMIHESVRECESIMDGHSFTQREYWADTATDRISWGRYNNDERAFNAIYVKPLNAEDDIMTDYFAGTFTKSIDQALRLAS